MYACHDEFPQAFPVRPHDRDGAVDPSFRYPLLLETLPGGPLHSEPPDHASTFPSRAGSASAHPATLLLVDDDPALRRALARALVHVGYEVLCASGGHDALALVECLDGPLDLLVTDIDLPELPGPALAERLRLSRPGLRVLFVSGYTASDLEHSGSFPTDGDLLTKPFTIHDLALRVREALETPGDDS